MVAEEKRFLPATMNDIAMYSDRRDQPKVHCVFVRVLLLSKKNMKTGIAVPFWKKAFRSVSKLGAVVGGSNLGINMARLCHAEKLEILLVLVVV